MIFLLLQEEEDIQYKLLLTREITAMSIFYDSDENINFLLLEAFLLIFFTNFESKVKF